jgi:hypothetical protein
MIRTTAFAALSLFAAVSQAADAVPTVRTTFDHPAVAVARMNQTAHVDSNTFLVQPPASVSWTVQPEAKLLATVAVAQPK